MGSAWNRNITPASVLSIEKLLVEVFRLIFHTPKLPGRLVGPLRPSLEKLRIIMADMPIAVAQLKGRPLSLWADDAVINGSCFKIKGLLVMSIVA